MLRRTLTLFLLLLLVCGCSRREVESSGTYYERKISPILTGSCGTSATGSLCHITSDARGNALGNLDVTSYSLLAKRQDLLTSYGPYGLPALLVKALPGQQLDLIAWDGTKERIVTDIPHAGGSVLDPSSAATSALERWLTNSAAENNAPKVTTKIPKEPCVDRIGSDSLFDPSTDPATPDFARFVSDVNDFLVANCAGKNCHGAPEGSFPLSCGTTPEQIRWNYFSASDYVAADPARSELLRRPLSPAQGGSYHEGGTFFSSPADDDYQRLLGWVTEKGEPTNVPSEPGFDVFAKRVQPMLVKRGCVLLGCHSPPSFNGFKLRAGSASSFGLATTRDNYHSVLKMVALESPDPNAGRLLRKNLEPVTERGIRHRGGALLAGSDLATCDLDAALTGPLDAQKPYCVIVAWLQKERAERTKNVVPLSSVIYVKRAPAIGTDGVLDFATPQPGSDLRRVDASLDATGQLTVGGNDQSLMPGCGLDAATADVRRPAVSWDGTQVAFAARSTATAPLRIYTLNANGSSCARHPVLDAPPTDEDGNLIPDNGHATDDFDPAFAPDGTLVFASTRGNVRKSAELKGPQRSPADPARLNANLYVLENGKVRQLTFLGNQELQPSFELNGQLLFTTEKREPGFYQLAARRINLDGGDYHPLFGQRRSVGYLQLTDIIQLVDGNFAGVLSDRGARHQAGTLAVINRSLGPDNASQAPDDYAQDPDAIDYAKTPFFQHSLTVLDPNATGRLTGTQGAYRNPSVLPNGSMLASYAANVIDLAAFDGNFDVVVVDPTNGARTPIPALSDANADELWPVAVFGRVNQGVFRSSPADPTGSAIIYTEDDDQPRTDRAELTFLDFPMIASLMFQNTRSGRQIQNMSSFELWESLPPEDETSLDVPSPYITEDQYGKVYARRRRVGTVSLEKDGSTRAQVPVGIPLLFGVLSQFAGESNPTEHHQLEETQYYPGEWVTLSFRRELFNGFCGGCHGATTGKEHDVSVKPDLLSQASQAIAKKASPQSIVTTPRGEPQGPPFP